MLNASEKQDKTNNAFDVSTVVKRLFGDRRQANSVKSNAGFSFGLKKAIRSVSSVVCPDIAVISWNGSRITGSIRCHKSPLSMLDTDIFSLTARTFTSKVVL